MLPDRSLDAKRHLLPRGESSGSRGNKLRTRPGAATIMSGDHDKWRVLPAWSGYPTRPKPKMLSTPHTSRSALPIGVHPSAHRTHSNSRMLLSGSYSRAKRNMLRNRPADQSGHLLSHRTAPRRRWAQLCGFLSARLSLVRTALCTGCPSSATGKTNMPTRLDEVH